jgi:sugar phosphate isomerase/epimerase
MKLSISNIAWDKENDTEMYPTLSRIGYSGIEIAPSRLFDQPVYSKREEVKALADEFQATYGLAISSIQSIWYGRAENIFKSEAQRTLLLDYTKQAIEFAEICRCENLVFGCPKNRVITEGVSSDVVIPFFREIGEYAEQHNTVVAIEANPQIYGTNFINRTEEAFELVDKVDRPGIRVNLDFGTILQNEEDILRLRGYVARINHVHISEPNLVRIEKHKKHEILAKVLRDEGFLRYVSIEMKRLSSMAEIKEIMLYIKEIFG